MTRTYTSTVVPCTHCGVELKWDELRFLWSDRDFLDHGGHYAAIRPEDEPRYWQAMKHADLRKGK